MKSGQNSSNQAAIKRIVPAVAMFALSAVMLSSSTYAWFTMNKEVEMKGLNMSATVGSGMEIALASVNGENEINGGAPDEEDTNEKGWKSSVVAAQYYKNIGKLRPASSTNGERLFDATDASDGGKKANNYKEITLGDATMAQTELHTALSADTNIGNAGNVGYYVDIPVYLRTNKTGSGEESIYCKMKIQKRDDAGNIIAATSDDLYKAVRIAFIKDGSSTGKIFGVDDTYYNGGAANDVGEGKRESVSVETSCVTVTGAFTDIDGVDSGLTIPLAAGTESDKYGDLAFKVRVWIEGESKFCSDSTAGQNWNIDLAFSMGQFETTTP